MRLGKLLENVNVTGTNVGTDIEINDINNRSGNVKNGSLFVAMKGISDDGYLHIDEAMKNGAVAVLTDRMPEQPDVPYVLTDNVRAAFSRVWASWYGNPEREIKIVGVTGTNGKTTTSYMLKSILEHSGRKTGLIGTVRYITKNESVDSSLTTPDPDVFFRLLREMVNSGLEYVVCEISSHALALDKLAGVVFELGIFTNLTQDHLDFHKTMEEYFKAKCKLFAVSKMAIINIDDPYGARLADSFDENKITCSAVTNFADICAKNIRHKTDSVEYEFLMRGLIYRIKCPVPGNFSVYNSMLAASAASMLGIPQSDIVTGIGDMGSVSGRMERIETGTDFSVIIDFAHTPDALKNVLHSIREYAPARLVCLFGCGGDRDKGKRPQMGRIAVENADYVVITSDNSRGEDPAAIIGDIMSGIKSMDKVRAEYKVIENRREAIKYVLRTAKSGDTILLAGKGHENYQIDKDGKHYFNERDIIREEMKSIRDRKK